MAMLTENEALEELKDITAWESEPALTDSQLLRCLNANLRYVDYPATGTVVEVDTIVCPAGSRRTWRCVTAGVILGRLAPDSYVTVYDGAAVWVDDGPAHAQRYDLNGAAHDAWMKKAAKAAELFDAAAPGQKFDQSQVYDHCVSMAARYQPVFVR